MSLSSGANAMALGVAALKNGGVAGDRPGVERVVCEELRSLAAVSSAVLDPLGVLPVYSWAVSRVLQSASVELPCLWFPDVGIGVAALDVRLSSSCNGASGDALDGSPFLLGSELRLPCTGQFGQTIASNLANSIISREWDWWRPDRDPCPLDRRRPLRCSVSREGRLRN